MPRAAAASAARAASAPAPTAPVRRAPAARPRAATAPARTAAPASAPRRRRPTPRPAGPPVRRPQPARRSAAAAALPRVSSDIVDRLLRGRGWVLCVGILLVGIVFTNVRLLELDRGIARGSERASALKRENSVLRMRAARLGSSERIQAVAAKQGLVMPQPGRVRYLRADRPADASLAAARITAPQPPSPPPADAQAPAQGSPSAAPSGASAGSTTATTATGASSGTGTGTGAAAPAAGGSTPSGSTASDR